MDKVENEQPLLGEKKPYSICSGEIKNNVLTSRTLSSKAIRLRNALIWLNLLFCLAIFFEDFAFFGLSKRDQSMWRYFTMLVQCVGPLLGFFAACDLKSDACGLLFCGVMMAVLAPVFTLSLMAEEAESHALFYVPTAAISCILGWLNIDLYLTVKSEMERK